MHPCPITITRTIYDPAVKGFVFGSAEGKAMPGVRQWIEKKNPLIYWYVLRIDNPSALQLEQWAVELYTHQALSITDAYIEGIERRFEPKKRERDPWSDKYVLSVSKQLGIPIVGSGFRRLFFKVDVNCREGLMHEYGISGRFIADGVGAVEIREKMFRYSCKVGEFRQIFNDNPEEASAYAEKRLSSRYSPSSVLLFTNSFRLIHDLYRYCNSGSIEKGELMSRLHLLHSNFEKVPELAGERLTPLLSTGIKELSILDLANITEFKLRYLRLCDSLVELLHLEVMGADLQEQKGNSPPAAWKIPPENPKTKTPSLDFKAGNGQLTCPVCGNLIDSQNRSLLCGSCGAQFCQICESWWFRGERKRGERPLCEKCFTAEQERIRKEKEEVRIKREKEEERLRKQREKEEEERRKLCNSAGMEFVKVPAGEFIMGSNEYSWEQPVHKVTIKTPFLLGKYPVTQKQWVKVMGSNPSYFKGDDLPVEQLSWEDVQEFIKRLNKLEGTDEYRLPSEAEWEYACRAGTTTRYSFGDDESRLVDYAWYDNNNSGSKTHPVGQKKPNPWGLYDMHGNVWEWCQDMWHYSYNGAPSDGSAWESGSSSGRVLRGGSWYCYARDCRSADRGRGVPGGRITDLGFRVMRTL